MATQTLAPRLTQRVILSDVSWQTYQRLLGELGDHRSSRLAYDQGVLEITMPSAHHERTKKLLERMIEALTEELQLPAKSFGSTTLNRPDLGRGAEPDSCYYIQHTGQIEGQRIDLSVDPPPDLIVEVDLSSPSSRRMAIYQHLGVPEIWRYADGMVAIYRLYEGSYVPGDSSATFPMVTTAVVNQFLQQTTAQDDTTFIRAWRGWIRRQFP